MKAVARILLWSLAGAGIVWIAIPAVTCGRSAGRRSREAHARHLISQLELAADQYAKVNGHFPPGDGKGSRGLVQALSETIPGRKGSYFELQPDLLRDGHVLNPIDSEAPGDAGILHYERRANGARPRFWFHTDGGRCVTNED